MTEMDEILNGALEAYRRGRPVVVLDEDEGVLHGDAFLHEIIACRGIDPDFSLEALVVHGISRKAFEATDWPEKLEAARQVFFLKND